LLDLSKSNKRVKFMIRNEQKLMTSKRRSTRAKNESLKTEFRDRLIGPTIKNALNIPFYRDFWKGIPADKIKTTGDLALLPLIDKALYQERYESDLPPGKMPSIVSHSTGTTGRMSFRFRSSEEIEYNWAFFDSVREKTCSTIKQIPLMLSVTGNYHGGKFPMPGNSYSMEAGVGDESELRQVHYLLQKTFNIPGLAPRITQIQASLDAIKLITLTLLEEGIQPSSLNIRVIVTTGEYVSPAWEKFIEETWRAKLINRYSLSEIFGGATRCSLCDSYHFDSHVVAEIVDPFTHLPIKTGVGVLVLSELYPFVQYQPLIRYLTGDLAEVTQSVCEPHGLSVKLIGRLSNSVVDPGKEPAVLIPPTALHDVFDELPEIARELEFTHIPGLSNYEFGQPKAAWKTDQKEGGPLEVTISAGATFNVRYHRERVLRLEKIIYDELRSRLPVLKKRIEKGFCELRIRIVDRSALASLDY